MKLRLLILSLLPVVLFAQITINEVSNANGSTIMQPDGSTSDWIELYNSSASPINLQGLGLSDKRSEPLKWIFPSYTIAPSSFLVVLASGKGQISTINHYETAVFAQDNWSYIIPSSNLPINWNTVGFDASSWTIAPFGIGYSDGDDATTIINPTTSVYARRLFNIADTSAIRRALFDIDFDDGFVAYLNGIEIARSGLTGNPPNFDDLSTDHEGQIYQGGNPLSFEIDPLILASAIQNGTNVLAVEVHNTTTTSSDLSLIPFLSFGFDTSTVFYSGIVHNWFNSGGSAGYLESNFTIKAKGETIFLSSTTGILMDSLVVPDLNPDWSYGKQTDGATTKVLFTTPTPNASNSTAIGYASQELTPTINFSGGFYPNTVSVSVTNNAASGGTLCYTLDGSTPTTSSSIYSTPLSIPSSAVLKVICFPSLPTILPSELATESYFIMEDFTLPVISITTDNANLYGAAGIFDNYFTDWKKPCVIEYFDADGKKQFESTASIKPDGGAGGSRSNPQHSVTIEPAHGVYGTGDPVHYPLIPEKGFITDYYAFYLRNGSNYWNQYPQKDATFMRMMRESNTGSQAYSPVIAYVNGEYFGIYELREKSNEGYFETNYGNDQDSLDLLSVSYFYGAEILRTVKGSDTGFYAMRDFVTSYNPTANDYFDRCNQKIDLYNFTDYISAENWFANFDWIYNNIKIARTQTAGNKWRFFLQDMELGLGGWGDFNSNMFDYFNNNYTPNPYHDIYAGLLQNTTYRNYFVNRYADLMNSTFQPNYYQPIVDSMYTQLLPDMPKHLHKWTGDVAGGMANYDNIHNNLLYQFQNRNAVVRNQIVTEFGLNESVNVLLDASPTGAGYIKISTIVPTSLPWTGVYFDGVPVQITAVANPGYTFVNWQPNGIIPTTTLDSAGLELNIPNDASFIALFSGSPEPLSITVSEIHYHADSSLNGGNWIEFHNYGSTSRSLDGWKVKSKHYWDEYTFPSNTTIPANGYLVIAEDTNQFKIVSPNVNNFIGSTHFGWSNKYDSIQLYDAHDSLRIQLIYTDSFPYPICADGWGRTLENINLVSTQLDESSWFCGCIGGSPGKAYSPCYESIYFSEIRTNNVSTSYNSGDWVEIKNNSNSPLSLNGYTFRDSKDNHIYPLPNVSIAPNGYWVMSNDNELFKQRYQDVSNVAGTFDFGLGLSDILRLYDPAGILVTSVIYDSQLPWAQEPLSADYTYEYADSNGYTDPNRSISWFAGCEGGSPGKAFTRCPDLPDDVFVFLYPNPSSTSINVVFDNEDNSTNTTEFQVFDINGKLIHVQKREAIESIVREEIDINSLDNGLYFIRVIQGGRVESLPFVKI